jgi:hypothetical protein
MRRKAHAFEQVRDVEGTLWNVREARGTKHGFDLLFGVPADDHGSYRGGLARLIATKALRDFWEANRAKHDGILYELPAGRTTLKRVRRRLGFHYHEDVAEFWTERIDDLRALSPRKFADLHKMDVKMVFETRTKFLGRRARELGWWRAPKILKVLRSNLTLRETGEKLGISISQAKRLKDQAGRKQD